MSNINELTNTLTSTVSTSSQSSADKSTISKSKDFDSVLVQALQNCNGERPAHVCCCDNLSAIELSEKSEQLKTDNENIVENDEISSESSKASEEISAGSCFTMFIKISTRITREAGDILCGKFKNTTLAFADALNRDRSYNENLLVSYMQKVDEKLSAQTADIKAYLADYIDNMFAAVKSSVNGLNTALLSSSNLLGDSLSSYSNLLGNTNLLTSSGLLGSSSQAMISNLSSSLFGASSSSSSANLSGYSAIDVANARVTAALNGSSNYTYGIGTSLNINRYAGRNLELIRSSQLETPSAGNLKMVDGKGKATVGVVPSGINVGESATSTIAKAETKTVINNPCSNENKAEDLNSSKADDFEEKKIDVKLVTSEKENPKAYHAAFIRKNNIIGMFKDMIMNSMNESSTNNSETGIKTIDAKVRVTFA